MVMIISSVLQPPERVRMEVGDHGIQGCAFLLCWYGTLAGYLGAELGDLFPTTTFSHGYFNLPCILN